MGRSIYEAPRPGRKHTIMSTEDRDKGKPTVWDEIEIKGNVKTLSLSLFNYTHLRVLYMSENQLQKIPPEIAKLQKLQVLDLSNNRLRVLPPELGDMPELRVLKMDSNQLRQLPYELGKLFQLEELGLANNPLPHEIQQAYEAGVVGFLQYMLDRLRFDGINSCLSCTSFSLSGLCEPQNVYAQPGSMHSYGTEEMDMDSQIYPEDTAAPTNSSNDCFYNYTSHQMRSNSRHAYSPQDTHSITASPLQPSLPGSLSAPFRPQYTQRQPFTQTNHMAGQLMLGGYRQETLPTISSSRRIPIVRESCSSAPPGLSSPQRSGKGWDGLDRSRWHDESIS